MQLLPWEIGFLGCRYQGCICRQNSHTTVATSSKLRALQESVTPVQSFAAETYFILIMITKGPQLILEINISLLIPEWWRLCTDIRTAYACVCGNESVHVYRAKECMKSTTVAAGR